MDDKPRGEDLRQTERPNRDQVAPPADTSRGTRSPDFDISLEDGAEIVSDGVVQPRKSDS